MQKTTLAVAVATISFLLVSALAQERTKPKTPSTVPELLSKAGASFGEGRYSACLSQIREATTLVMAERAKVIRAALPAAPKGLEKVAPNEADAAMAGGFAAALASTVGSVVNQEYSGEGKSISVTVTADSPLFQMFGMWIANPEMLEPGSELIKYGSLKAVLKNDGSGGFGLQILIDKTMVQIDSNGLSADELLAFMSQKAVDALTAALAK